MIEKKFDLCQKLKNKLNNVISNFYEEMSSLLLFFVKFLSLLPAKETFFTKKAKRQESSIIFNFPTSHINYMIFISFFHLTIKRNRNLYYFQFIIGIHQMSSIYIYILEHNLVSNFTISYKCDFQPNR